jgi:hypothetical protein
MFAGAAHPLRASSRRVAPRVDEAHGRRRVELRLAEEREVVVPRREAEPEVEPADELRGEDGIDVEARALRIDEALEVLDARGERDVLVEAALVADEESG